MTTPLPLPACARDSFRIAGFRIDPMTSAEVIDTIGHAVETRQRLIMANINFHGMAAALDNAPMRSLLEQPDTRVIIDSMPFIFLTKILGYKLRREHRTTSLDFYADLFELGAQKNWRFGFLGTTPDNLAKGLAILKQRHPNLDIDGHHGYFDIHDTTPQSIHAHIIDWLRQRSHDILIVGMGMPRQEEWIQTVQSHVPTRVFLPTGGYLDYQIGVQKRAPRWMGQIGLEWAFRLAANPKRLSYRYLVEPFILIAKLSSKKRSHTS